MTKVSTAKAKSQFSEMIDRVSRGKERVVLTQSGKDIVAVVPIEDVKLLEEIEDHLDNMSADEALKEPGTIPWEKIKKDLGL